MAEGTTLEAVAGFLSPTALFVVLVVLHSVIPARRVAGYAHPNTEATEYRLNGGLVFIAALLTWWFEITGAPLDWLWRVKWHAIAGGVALSAVLTTWCVFRAPADERNPLAQWLDGRARNMRSPDRAFLGFMQPTTISDGKKPSSAAVSGAPPGT